MESEHRLEAKAIGQEALALSPDARAAFIDLKCRGDAKLRAEVEDFLRIHALLQGAETVQGPHVDVKEQPEPRSRSANIPVDRIGPYRILQQIGQGGFGVVYLAEQEQPVRRRVALKIIKAGMDTPEVLARFEAERQALAMMDHSGVARVFDAGMTDQGRPYFVMEFVQGIPIVEYCDKNRLSNRQRLDLFIHVCEAVQHAHQKGIIHRDLKPSNILITIQDGNPVPKVIDFGIAKALHQRLTDHTIYTELGQLMGTPEYMSPEQADMTGLNIDTRTDIYSLGVILYQLLVGALPFDSSELRRAGLLELQRVIKEREPSKPSTKLLTLVDATRSAAHNRNTNPDTLIRQVRGDLDWITLKAMDKDRTRRYASATELAADVQRYLHDEPVLASPPSGIYRMKKFVRRNRGIVATGMAVTVALVLGLSAATYGLVQARVERDKTRKERDRAVDAEKEGRRLLAQSFARSAELARQRGNWSVAIENYRQAIDTGHPEPARLRLGVISCLWAQSEEKKAEDEFDVLVKQPHPEELAGSILLWQAEFAFNQGNTKRVRKLLDEAVRRGIPPADEAYARSLLAKNIPEAVKYLEKAIEHEPFHHRAITMLASTYFLSGKRERAAAQFEVASGMYPEDQQTHIAFAAMMAFQGGTDAASRAVEMIRARHGDATAQKVSELVRAISPMHPTFEQTEGKGDPNKDIIGYLKNVSTILELIHKAFGKGGFDSVALPPCIESLVDIPNAMTLSALRQHKRAAAMFQKMTEAVPVGELKLILANELRQGGRLEEAADEAWSVVHGGTLIFAPPSLAMRANIVLESEIVKRDSKNGPHVFRRKEQFVRVLRALAMESSTGDFGLAAAHWAIELGELDAAQNLLRSSRKNGPSALLLEAEIELARGANGPAIEASAAVLKADPKNQDARQIFDEAVRSLGLVGRRGAGVAVEEYVAKYTPTSDNEHSAPATTAPAAEDENG